jgi:hypothetical protein
MSDEKRTEFQPQLIFLLCFVEQVQVMAKPMQYTAPVQATYAAPAQTTMVQPQQVQLVQRPVQQFVTTQAPVQVCIISHLLRRNSLWKHFHGFRQDFANVVHFLVSGRNFMQK